MAVIGSHRIGRQSGLCRGLAAGAGIANYPPAIPVRLASGVGAPPDRDHALALARWGEAEARPCRHYLTALLEQSAARIDHLGFVAQLVGQRRLGNLA